MDSDLPNRTSTYIHTYIHTCLFGYIPRYLLTQVRECNVL